MSKKEQFLEFLTKVGLNENQSEVQEYIAKAFPEKKERVIKHKCLILDNLSDEEVAEFLEEPEEWLMDGDLPSFSFDKGSIPKTEEGENFYVRINGKYYSMTLHEGECVEASWSGSIYKTDIQNFQEIPEENYGNYNFVKWSY